MTCGSVRCGHTCGSPGSQVEGLPSTHLDLERCHPTEGWDPKQNSLLLLLQAVTFILHLEFTFLVEPQDNCLLTFLIVNGGLWLREGR